MEKDKNYFKYRLGLGLRRWIDENDKTARESGEESNLITTLRGLETATGLSWNIVHTISVGTRNPSYTTLEQIAEALGIPLSTWLAYCEAIPEADVINSIKQQEKKKAKKKTTSKTNKK
ncbi:hypothetical protein ACE38W_17485 [Chitinophaga sp. Hz27]|uniref:hypothetical protein n=1 Tax=Chitinophaga sp. Hz27 TaxID=3347169 RepID=UPI0035DFD637